MDIMMPVMNGYDATRAIRASDHPMAKTIPIIAMTANAYQEDVEKAKDAGMNAHVPKPINIKLLFSVLEQYRNGLQSADE
jgi:CheY-like chemotaxis protein